MLRVNVEIVPHGDEALKRQIATIELSNVSALSSVSDYVVEADLEGRKLKTTVPRHHRALGWMPLVFRALAALIKLTSPGGES